MKRTGLVLAMLMVLLLTGGMLFAGGEKEGAAAGEAKGATVPDVKVMRVSHTLAPNSHYHQGLLKLDELLRQKSNGRLQLEVFHSAQLGSERDVVEGVSLGTIEMTLTSSAPLANFTNAFLVFDLPFVITDRQKAYQWMDGTEGQKILTSLEPAGIKGLGIWENGFRNLTNSQKPVTSPKDLNGLKIRLMENPIHVNTFVTMGARAVPMPFGELFTALQQKTVDGQENPLVIIDTSRFYEVQGYLTLTGHFYAPAILLMNLNYWNNTLNEEDRRIFMEAEKEARVLGAELQHRVREEAAVGTRVERYEGHRREQAGMVPGGTAGLPEVRRSGECGSAPEPGQRTEVVEARP